MSGTSTTRITLVTSNGWGLGHLTRQLAVALAIAERAHVTMFSLSPGFPLAARFGIKGEYCPSYTTRWIARREWEDYLEARVLAFFEEVCPDVVLFDGVAPYTGFLNAARQLTRTSVGWLRRGMWRQGGVNAHHLDKAAGFDFVVEPGDLAAAVDHGATVGTDAIRVPPISLLEVLPQFDRGEAARALGIDPARPALLLTLGSGRLGDVEGPGSTAMSVALAQPDWQICVTNSPVAVNLVPLADDDRVVEIKGVYPLLQYLNAFDAVVSSAGYNSVHELIPAGVPTLLVPNTSSQTDDQVARAQFLADEGLALMARDDDLDQVAKVTEALLLERTRHDLADALAAAGVRQKIGGANAVADLLLTPPPVVTRAAIDLRWSDSTPRGVVKRILGPRGVALVRSILGRSDPSEATQRTKVTMDVPGTADAFPLMVTEDPDAVEPRAEYPIEHIIEGASETYRGARMRLIRRFYDVAR